MEGRFGYLRGVKIAVMAFYGVLWCRHPVRMYDHVHGRPVWRCFDCARVKERTT